MKRRTFLTTLALFLFFFNLGIFIISVTMFKDTVSRTEERSLAEHYFIASALIKDFYTVERRGINIEGSLSSLLQPYSYLSVDKKAGLVLYHNNQPVYSNQNTLALQHNSMAVPKDGSRAATVQKTEKGTFVIVSGKLPAPYDPYTLIYTYDMTDAIRSWSYLKNILFMAGFAFSLFLAFCLLIILNRIFKPLKQISLTSKDIANGAYETRLTVYGHDELAEMAQSFNHMAEEIQHQMVALIDTADKKQQFIDNFAHELRTPLTAIYGYAEYMQKAVLTEDDRLSALDYVMSECRRLQTIAFQLLELANLKNDQIKYEDQNVSSLFERVEQTLYRKLSEKNILVEFRNEIETIRGDAALLESLLINLIDNAINASEKGKHVLVLATKETNKKMISIQDNGKGMPTEVLTQITEPFYRGEKSRNRNDGGAGLGLAICKQIALCHNAELSFASCPGEGTTAKITFTAS